jgi:hypothetical protein
VFSGPGWVSYGLPLLPGQLRAFEAAQRTRRTLTPQQVAEAYREALGSRDPDVRRQPTEATAARLGYSRGHISRMLTQARRKGLPGLGDMRPPRASSRSGPARPVAES